MPFFSMHDLPMLMRDNHRNTLTTFSKDGGRRRITYAQVHRDTCAAITYLREHSKHFGPDARVIVSGAPNYDWLIAGLACLFIGAELVALPETLTNEEVGVSLAGLDVNLALLDERLLAYDSLSATARLPLNGLTEHIATSAIANVERSPRMRVVAFTSGSTANAKLKMFRIDMESTSHFIDNFTSIFGLTHDDVWAVCHSFSHIVHFEYVLGGLGWGYDLVITDVLRLLTNGTTLQPSVLVTVPSVYEQLAQQIRRRCTQSGLDNAALEQLFEQRWQRHAAGEELELMPQAAAVIGGRLKMMLIGAAPSALSLKRFLLAAGLPVFEGYGMSEVNMIACNTPARSRFGSVGPMWPGIQSRIDDEGVLCVRPSFHRSDAYLNSTAEDNASTFTADGWVCTGDLAEIENGFVKIMGRKKEILISSGGKKINVASIESRLREVPGVGHALVFGDRRPYLVAIFAPEAGRLLPEEAALRQAINAINQTLPNHERLLGFVRLGAPLDIQSGLLTRSGKPRRQVIEQRLADEIGRCYA